MAWYIKHRTFNNVRGAQFSDKKFDSNDQRADILVTRQHESNLSGF